MSMGQCMCVWACVRAGGRAGGHACVRLAADGHDYLVRLTRCIPRPVPSACLCQGWFGTYRINCVCVCVCVWAWVRVCVWSTVLQCVSVCCVAIPYSAPCPQGSF